MGGADVIDIKGGQRTRGAGTRTGEWTVAGAGAALAVSFIPEGWLDPFQISLSSIVLTGVFKEATKQALLRGWLAPDPGDRESGLGSGISKVGLVLLLGLALGCAGGIGHQKPHFHTGADGETVMTCEQTGVFWAFGDASQCGSQRGGTASTSARDMLLGTVRLATQAVAGFFGGVGAMGAGMGAAVAQPTPEEFTAPPATLPADTSERTEGASPGGDGLPDWRTPR